MDKKKILIVDDEPDIVYLLQQYLELNGYQTLVAGDMVQIIQDIQAEQVDLLILDVMMKGINGWQICREIKNNSGLNHIPVIIMSARTQQVDQARSYDNGANYYITKPFDFKELSGAIEKLVG
ncbi:MAG: response regulator transcription factor [bacterium]|nr:response regulator transcription factor [bacterium]